jgi:hypothetical protein
VIGLVAGVAAFGFTSSTTVSSPVTKPASFTKSASAGVAEPAAPVAASKAPCAKGQELEHGICIVHVERVVVHQRPTVIQAQSQQSQSQSRSSDDSANNSQAATTVERSPRSQEDSSLSSSSGREGEAPDHEDSDDHQDSNAPDSNAHEAAEHAAEGETED